MPYESFPIEEVSRFKTEQAKFNAFSALLESACELQLIINLRTKGKSAMALAFRSYPVVYREFCTQYKDYYGSAEPLYIDGGLGLLQALSTLLKIRQEMLESSRFAAARILS